MPNLLFICTANQFRSPIAAACFSKALAQTGHAEGWVVGSAGTWAQANLPAHPEALEAAKPLGLDLSEHRTREVKAEMLTAADLIVVMEPNQVEALRIEFPAIRSKIALLSHLAKYSKDRIPDPAANNFNNAGEIAVLVNDSITAAFDEILLRVLNLSGEDSK